MKNILFVIGALFLLVLFSGYLTEEQIIPEDAIRIRVIANSDSWEDQNLKKEIKDELEYYLYDKLSDVRSTELADKIIKDNLPEVEKIVEKYTLDYNVDYGMNYFPAKEYKGITYDEGEYKSLVVTINEGLGNNWWCVLFPPLCMLEAEESTDVEYQSFVFETIEKYID